MDEKDIWRTAKLLIDQHGADAATHAAMCADEMLEAGNVDGVSVWKCVMKAIKDLTSGDPSGITH